MRNCEGSISSVAAAYCNRLLQQGGAAAAQLQYEATVSHKIDDGDGHSASLVIGATAYAAVCLELPAGWHRFRDETRAPDVDANDVAA